jgi:DNA gyrase subunit A
VSRKGQSVRFTATDEVLRPMGRATSGVTGMKFRDGDHLLAMDVVRAGEDLEVFVVFENGLAKRTPVDQYRLQGRGGLGIKVAKLSDKGGDLVGALLVNDDDEVLVVMEKGKIVRSRVDGVRLTGRDTQGVRFATPDSGDAIIGVARSVEREVEEAADEAVAEATEEIVEGLTGDTSTAPEAAGAGDDAAAGVGADAVDGVTSDAEDDETAAPAADSDGRAPGGEQ